MSVDAVSERCPQHPHLPACWKFEKGNTWPATGLRGAVSAHWGSAPLPKSQWPEIVERWCSECGRQLGPAS